MALYYERRFTKLGFSAASILNALPYLQMLLSESHLTNQHIEMVRLFLDCELFISELSVLAYFTHCISLPLLNCVEVSSQDELLNIFPRFYHDLLCGNMDSMNEFLVIYPHVKITKPTSEVELLLLNEMCKDAADALDMQCGREYGFGKFKDKEQRATKLYDLTTEQLKDLPTNNIIAEREFSVFDRKSIAAKCRNHKFRAISIRNDMTLYKSTTFQTSATRKVKQIMKELDVHEKMWNEQQKMLFESKLLEKVKKGKQQSMYTSKLLQQCKSWNGPATCLEELSDILKNNPDNLEKIV